MGILKLYNSLSKYPTLKLLNYLKEDKFTEDEKEVARSILISRGRQKDLIALM
jgi:hypothetical protein